MNRNDRIDVTAGSLLVVLCALWGLTQVAIKLAGQEGLPPMLQAGLRSTGSAALLCGWIFLRGGPTGLRRLFAPDGAFWPGMLIAAMFAGEFLCIYPGMQLTTASRGTLFVYTSPFWVAVGAHFLVPGERLGLRQVIGLFCAFVGVGCAVADGLWQDGGSLAGDGLIALGAAIWGMTTVTIKASRRLQAIPPSKQLLYQLGGSIPYFFVAAALLGEFHQVHATPAAWGWLGYQTVVVAFVTYLAWFWLIANYPAGRLAAFSFLTPIFGALMGALLLHEHVSAELVLALLFVGTGIRLVNGPRRAPATRMVPAAQAVLSEPRG